MGLFKKKEKRSSGKAAGGGSFYFLLHNIISLPTFFFIAVVLHLSEYIPTTLNELFSLKYLQFFGLSLIIHYFVGFLSRLVGYGLLLFYYSWEEPRIYKKKKEIPPFGDMLNDGTLGYFTKPFLVLMLLSTLAFTLGAAQLVQYKVFNDDSTLAVVLSYLLIKIVIGVYIYFKYK